LRNARQGLGLTEGSLIERRKLPVCATVAETIFPFHYALIRGFRLFTRATLVVAFISQRPSTHGTVGKYSRVASATAEFNRR
jgi:hypothetical protein